MPDGPRKASLRAPTTMERIKSGLQDTFGIPERLWGAPLPDQAIEARRQIDDARAAKGPVMRAPTTLERIRDTLQPVTNVVEALGSPLENAELGPAKAITLVTKKPLTELLRRLHPRNAAGMMVDPAEFPETVDAVQGAVHLYPRVMSHLNSIAMDIPEAAEALGKIRFPNHILKQLQAIGPDLWRRNDAGPVASMHLNPAIEKYGGEHAWGPVSTIFHEVGHLGQFVADPRRYDEASNNAARALKDIGADPYALHPLEVSARAIGMRNVQKLGGYKVQPYGPMMQREIDPFGSGTPADLADLWKMARSGIR